ncbi:MAG: DUF4303 domain-containing protein [Planctomycetaceae bacterium]
MEIDASTFMKLRAAIRDEAAKAFADLQQESPGESVYVFGLFDYADYSCPTLFYGSSTEQYLAKRLKEGDLSVESARWSPVFWGTNGQLAAAPMVEEIVEQSGLAEDDDYDALLDFAEHVRAEMVLALRELDAQGLFGTGNDRNQLTLTVSTQDEANSDEWTHLISARLLNPENVFRKYLVELRRANQESDLSNAEIEELIGQLDDSTLALLVNHGA